MYHHRDEFSDDQKELSRILQGLCDTVGNGDLAAIFKVTPSAISHHNAKGTGPFADLQLYFLRVYGKRHDKPHVLKTLKDLCNYLFRPVGLRCYVMPKEYAGGSLSEYFHSLSETIKEISDIARASSEGLADGEQTVEDIQREIVEVEEAVDYLQRHKIVLLQRKEEVKRIEEKKDLRRAK